MSDLEPLSTFRAYVADPDEAALARAHRAVAMASRVRTRRRSDLARRGALVAAVAVVAALLIALQPSSDRGGPPVGTSGTGPGKLGLPSIAQASAAQVRRGVVAAIDAADGILHERTRTMFLASGQRITSESWSDLRHPDAFRSREDRREWSEPGSGVTLTDAGQVPLGGEKLLLRRIIDGRCSELLLRSRGGFGTAAHSALDQIRSDIRTYRFRLIGIEEIGGRSVAHLRHTAVAERTELWVDTATYRPIRSVEITGDPYRRSQRPERAATEDQRLRNPRTPGRPGILAATATAHRRALPTHHPSTAMNGATGLEPATSGVTGGERSRCRWRRALCARSRSPLSDCAVASADRKRCEREDRGHARQRSVQRRQRATNRAGCRAAMHASCTRSGLASTTHVFAEVLVADCFGAGADEEASASEPPAVRRRRAKRAALEVVEMLPTRLVVHLRLRVTSDAGSRCHGSTGPPTRCSTSVPRSARCSSSRSTTRCRRRSTRPCPRRA